MRVFVFGATGMIGRYVHRYIKDSIAVTRSDVDAEVLSRSVLYRSLGKLNIKADDVIINCTGVTNKQDVTDINFLAVNSIFPRLLSDYCETKGVHLIHVSTDCVFSGDKGFYDEDSIHDNTSIYGASKSAGEPPNATIIRTSIIGENPLHCKDLLEWVRNYSYKEIPGWTNHYWNGMTCLQFAKICNTIIEKRIFWKGVRHIYGQFLSKYNLVEIINDVYDCGHVVVQSEADESCNRILRSKYATIFDMPSIRDQLKEQKEYGHLLFDNHV